MSLGENITRLRMERGLSQETLADTLGVSRQSVSKWETDASTPELEKLMRLSEVFGVTLDALVKGTAFTEEKVEIPGSSEESAGEAWQNTVPVRSVANRRAGCVFLILGAAVTIFLGLLGGLAAGLLFGLPFYICAVICLTSHGKRTWLWCCWGLFFAVDLYLRYATGLAWTTIFHTFVWTAQMNYARLAIAWAQFLVMMWLIAGTALSCGKEPWRGENSWKKTLVLGAAGLVVATGLMALITQILRKERFFDDELFSVLRMSRIVLDYIRMALVAWMGSGLLRRRRERRENAVK